MMSTNALVRAQMFIAGLGRFPRFFPGPVLVKVVSCFGPFIFLSSFGLVIRCGTNVEEGMTDKMLKHITLTL